jgi:hypothetical protein
MVGIRNGRGITRDTLGSGRQQAYQEGQWVGDGRDVSYTNPYLPQISTITLAAVADVSDEVVAGQVWTFTFTNDAYGDVITHTYTVTADDNTAATDGAGLAYMATTLAASLEANVELDNVLNASGDAAVITLTFLHAGQAWTVAASCAPAAAEAVLTSTEATSQTAGGSTIPMARFVAYGSPVPNGPGGPGRRAVLPTAVTSRIAGIALTDPLAVRPFDTTNSSVNAYAVGSIVNVREEGEVAMVNQGGAAAVAGDPVYCVVSTAGGDLLGEARSTPAGTADVWTLTPAAVNASVYGISIHFPAWNGQAAQTFVVPPVTADGSADATEIVTLLAASIATVAELPSLLTTSGTDTLILTADARGRPFTVYDSAEAGDFTSITHTTTAAAYTVLVPAARWTIPTAVGAIGRVFVRQTLHG